MIKRTNERHVIEATSIENITKALATGKMTTQEAIGFMAVLKLGAEVSAIENGDMSQQGVGNSGGITIVLPDTTTTSSATKPNVEFTSQEDKGT